MVSTDQMMELPQERNFEERPLSRKVLQGAIEFRGSTSPTRTSRTWR
jgi:ATP-binding cassette subfamily C protein LapB